MCSNNQKEDKASPLHKLISSKMALFINTHIFILTTSGLRAWQKVQIELNIKAVAIEALKTNKNLYDTKSHAGTWLW